MAFQFKQFSVEDTGCTLKVGTDGVLLGTWADVSGCSKILDIGTGSGVIALMLAQRNSSAMIEAVEIDKFSTEQAEKNICSSPWQDRISLFNSTIQEFAKQEKFFDLIVCSPPYFRNSMKPLKREDLFSKHDDNLPYEALIAVAFKMLNINGKFCLILPSSEEIYFKRLASAQGFHITKMLHMLPVSGKPAKRVLMQFEKSRKKLSIEEIAVLSSPAGEYTSEYKKLTKDFYLYF
jgi:tRNA1Val (adenine37-N6)-methyltransferase